ncbi:MAG: tautomerase family protein [Betaproteobacteria bacterium]|jgi:phenylpyruvate tautomerase PptA (4-oxalocrotonate tautomerase family)
MPTYTVTYSGVILSSDVKQMIAQGITSTHNKITGANSYFAQVIFKETHAGDHFMGGKPVLEPQIFLHGQIREGRPNALKQKLICGLRDQLMIDSEFQKDQVWVYLVDLIPAQMIEYGEVLPESGGEVEWFNNLPEQLKDKLSAMENR